MFPSPCPDWYRLQRIDGEVRLLTDDGNANPTLTNTSLAPLCALAAAIHLHARQLNEADLRQAEAFLAMQRWRRSGP
jgi:hypothetical protein